MDDKGQDDRPRTFEAWKEQYQKRLLNEIQWESMTRPFGFSTLSLASKNSEGDSETRWRQRICHTVASYSVQVNRELSAEERDAWAEKHTKASWWLSFAPLVGLTSTFVLDRRGEYFSFKRPWANMKTKSLAFGERFIRGSLWMAVNFALAYCTVGMFICLPIVRAPDARLNNWYRDRQRIYDNEGLIVSQELRRNPEGRLGTVSQDPKRPDAPARHLFDAEQGDNRPGAAVVFSRKGQGFPYPHTRDSSVNTASRASASSQSAWSGDDSYLYGDDSPAAPAVQKTAQGAAAPKATTTWDDIRRRAAEASGQDSLAKRRQEAARNNEGGQSRDQYSYSSSEQEKAYAKEQSQKEFDALVERERRGENWNNRE